MLETFDFCENSRVIKEIAPKEAEPIDFNGWDFSVRPVLPYRRSFVVTLYGLRWSLGIGTLDLSGNHGNNAGRLLKFYRDHRLYKSFLLNHEYLGPIECRFMQPVNIEPALVNSGGLIEALDISMVHHNPSY